MRLFCARNSGWSLGQLFQCPHQEGSANRTNIFTEALKRGSIHGRDDTTLTTAVVKCPEIRQLLETVRCALVGIVSTSGAICALTCSSVAGACVSLTSLTACRLEGQLSKFLRHTHCVLLSTRPSFFMYDMPLLMLIP